MEKHCESAKRFGEEQTMNKQDQKSGNLWAGFEIIHAYTREQALEDGVLVDITKWAQEAGFRIPVAVTCGVWNILKPSEKQAANGEDATGRTWDMLMILRLSIRGAKHTDEIHFAPLFTMDSEQNRIPIKMWSKCGPGDHAEPVITVMLEGED